MKRLLLLALIAAAPVRAAVLVEPIAVPSYSAISAPAALAAPALLSISPAASISLPPSVSIAPVAASAPALLPAPAAAAPPVAATDTGLIRAPDLASGLAELRRGSYEVHPQIEAIVARINALRPELPITAKNLFLVRDREMLRSLGIPEDAAGAARIVTDGKTEVPVVILVAARPVALDAFVEYAVHEAVHLMDDGILRVRHDQELKHFFAEGWTQKRAVVLANEILTDLGRPATPGAAYHQEIALVEAFIALHGSGPLDELVRTGSDAGLRRALGGRWDLAARLISGDGAAPGPRRRRIDALTALISAKSVGPDEERLLLDYVRR
ncbi:MAG: hypothetical protein ACHQ51_07550 [Elusimicrobiota bacterium]